MEDMSYRLKMQLGWGWCCFEIWVRVTQPRIVYRCDWIGFLPLKMSKEVRFRNDTVDGSEIRLTG